MGVFRAVWTLINVAAGVGDPLGREYRGGGGDSSCMVHCGLVGTSLSLIGTMVVMANRNAGSAAGRYG